MAGVKGMRWGHRKATIVGGDSTPKPKKTWTEDQKHKTKQLALLAGTVAVSAGAIYIQQQRWANGADARLFAANAGELQRRVGQVFIADLLG